MSFRSMLNATATVYKPLFQLTTAAEELEFRAPFGDIPINVHSSGGDKTRSPAGLDISGSLTAFIEFGRDVEAEDHLLVSGITYVVEHIGDPGGRSTHLEALISLVEAEKLAATNYFVRAEKLGGVSDGANKVFTFVNVPVSGQVSLYVVDEAGSTTRRVVTFTLDAPNKKVTLGASVPAPTATESVYSDYIRTI